jgi:hypothetical protein
MNIFLLNRLYVQAPYDECRSAAGQGRGVSDAKAELVRSEA